MQPDKIVTLIPMTSIAEGQAIKFKSPVDYLDIVRDVNGSIVLIARRRQAGEPEPLYATEQPPIKRRQHKLTLEIARMMLESQKKIGYKNLLPYEVAEHTGVKIGTVHRYLNSGKIEADQHGLISLHEFLEAYIASVSRQSHKIAQAKKAKRVVML